jgi:hypothetical protein
MDTLNGTGGSRGATGSDEHRRFVQRAHDDMHKRIDRLVFDQPLIDRVSD